MVGASKLLPDTWSKELWQTILAKIHEQVPSGHPQTIRLDLCGQPKSYFLKILPLDINMGFGEGLVS